MYETLFERTVGGDYVGLLASSGTPSADLKTWTITLREGIKFHDGVAFNAASVVTNYQAITGLIAAGAFAAGGLAGYASKGYTVGTGAAFAANIKSFSAKSTYVVEFILDRAEATFIKDRRLRKSVATEYKAPVEYYPSLWLNQGKPGSPFANKNARLALLTCIDRVNYAKVRGKGETTVAKSLVGPKSDMYSTSGFSKFDVKASKAFVAAYKKETGKADLTFSMPSDQSSASQANAKFLVEQWKKCGITANVVVEESAVIIAKAFNAAPKVAAGEFYNAYDMIPILLFEGTDVTFNLPFVVTNAFPATSTSPVKALFQNSVGVVLSLNHHSDTAVDTIFYAGQAAQTRTGAKVKYKEGTTYLQTNGFMGSINHIYYSLFTTKKLAGIGSLQLVKGKTQRVVTNFGIDWTGVYKTAK